jgi:hypothetical protein
MLACKQGGWRTRRRTGAAMLFAAMIGRVRGLV